MTTIKERLENITATLPDTTQLIAVSKFHPKEAIVEAYNAGQRLFGESRVQELLEKQPYLPEDIEWHFIGTLQRNKVKYIIPFVHTIHSIDSIKLLDEVEKQCNRLHRVRIKVLIQVHISGEETKHGFSKEELDQLLRVDLPNRYPHIEFTGLMGMASLTDDTSIVETEFARLQELSQKIKAKRLLGFEHLNELSIGMSDDYESAIRHGSTYIRIGTAIFGERSCD